MALARDRADASRLSKQGRKARARALPSRMAGLLRQMAVWGPGLLVMLADTDAGNVVTAAQGGARYGFRLLPLLLLLIPLLYLVQELTVRLGICTGRGFNALVRERFGPFWAWLSLAGLVIAAAGSLVTEFTGIAGVGELYGLPRGLTVPLAGAALLAIAALGSYRRAERLAVAIGLFLLAFLAVGLAAHPDAGAIAREAFDLPLGDREFLYLSAAFVGMTFNPWMIFYQQSAIAEKNLQPKDYGAARFETAAGAILTQLLSGAVLAAAAATVFDSLRPLDSIGEISKALSPLLGEAAGRAAFALGVVGGSTVAAVVSLLALAWAAGEAAGYGHGLEHRPFEAKWFYGICAASVAGAATLVLYSRDLVSLNIAAQVLNAFLLPIVLGLLLALAATALPLPLRPGRVRLALLCSICVILCAIGLLGGLAVLR